jgi:hypothetical protein
MHEIRATLALEHIAERYDSRAIVDNSDLAEIMHLMSRSFSDVLPDVYQVRYVTA